MTTATNLQWYLLFVYAITINARSLLPDPNPISLSDSVANEDRHRLEHTSAVQTLRWTPRKLEQSELCGFCDVIVPVVSELTGFEMVEVDRLLMNIR